MVDFVPVSQYTNIYYYLILLIVLITFLNTQLGYTRDRTFEKAAGYFLLIFVIMYLGLRPISGVFLDMTTYAHIFEGFVDGRAIPSDGDYLFYLFTFWAAKIMTVEFYFFTCALIYVGPLYIVAKRWFGQYWYYAFLLLVASFSFWAYGTNGIRNGMATSLFLLAVSQKKVWQTAFWVTIAVLMHKSMLLPTVGFILAHFLKKPKYFIIFWFVCIPLSLVGGGMWEAFFGGLGFGDDRIEYLTASANLRNGFRWDFLIYSSVPVIFGWYYIYKKSYSDPVYFLILNTYIFANAFWILVIRASFSNRFAYLSWFIMAIVIIYPVLKSRVIPHQFRFIGVLTLFYFTFSFIMSIILK